jgi:hypothetical protein
MTTFQIAATSIDQCVCAEGIQIEKERRNMKVREPEITEPLNIGHQCPKFSGLKKFTWSFFGPKSIFCPIL